VNEHFAAVDTDTERHLVKTAAFPLELRDRFVDSVVRDQAAVYTEEAMASALDKTDLAPALGREADVVAVAPRSVRADRRGHRRVREAADSAELLAHDVLLE
jgi:hypothetical protein